MSGVINDVKVFKRILIRNRRTRPTKGMKKVKTTLITDLTVAGICDGFVYKQLEGKRVVRVGREAHHPAGVPAQLHLCG